MTSLLVIWAPPIKNPGYVYAVIYSLVMSKIRLKTCTIWLRGELKLPDCVTAPSFFSVTDPPSSFSVIYSVEYVICQGIEENTNSLHPFERKVTYQDLKKKKEH